MHLAPNEPLPVAAARRPRVLAIDDEMSVLQTIRRALGEGHDVELALSVREALERIEADPNFDLILCDVLLPEQTGMELYAILKASRPALVSRVLFITGAWSNDSVRLFLESARQPCLPKPFGIDELSAIVSVLVAPSLAAPQR